MDNPTDSVKFTVYQTTTGRIERAGRCPRSDAPAQAFYTGEAVLIGSVPSDFVVGDRLGNDETHKVVITNGVPAIVAI